MEYLEKLKENMARDGFMKYTHIRLTALQEGSCELRTDLTADFLNPHGVAHGGLLFTLCDTAAGIAATSMGRGAVTQSGDIHFLHPGTGSTLIARGRVVKCGLHTAYCTTEVLDEQNTLVACGSFEMFYVGSDRLRAPEEKA